MSVQKRKADFVWWLTQQKNANDSLYLESVARQYASHLSIAPTSLATNPWLEYDLVYECNSAVEYESLRRKIEAAPNYVTVDRRTNNGLSAGLNAYTRYIAYLEASLERSADNSIAKLQSTSEQPTDQSVTERIRIAVERVKANEAAMQQAQTAVEQKANQPLSASNSTQLDSSSSTEPLPRMRQAIETAMEKISQQSPAINAALLDLSSSIEQLPLSVRSSNALKKSNIVTVEQLLGLDADMLFEVKNLGAKSVTEILTIQEQLKKSFEKKQIRTEFLPRVRQIVKNALNIGRLPDLTTFTLTPDEYEQLEIATQILDAIGIDVVRDFKTSPQRIQPIVEMFAEYTYSSQARSRLQRAYDGIPEIRRGRLLRNYMAAANKDEPWKKSPELCVLLAEVTAIAEIPAIFDGVACGEAEQVGALEGLLKFLSLDYVQLVSMTLQNTISAAKSLLADTLRERAAGRTLQELAEQHKCTRERVRQKESKLLRQIDTAFQSLPMHPLAIAFVENDADAILSIEKLTAFYAQMEDNDLLLYYFKNSVVSIAGDKANRPTMAIAGYHFSKESNAFIKDTSVKDSVRVDRAIANLPQVVLVDELLSTLKTVCETTGVPVELIEQKFLAAYYLSGKAYCRGKLNMPVICDIILKEYYPSGIRIYDDAEIQLFRERVQELLGDVTLSENNRALEARIADQAVLFGRGIYIHPCCLQIPQDVLEAIIEFIRGGAQGNFQYSDLFETFREILSVRTNITNRYALQGALKFHCEQNNVGFCFRKDFLTTAVTSSTNEQSVFSEEPMILDVTLDPLLAKRLKQVLAERFSNGFRLESPIELMRLRRFAATDTGGNIALADDELKSAISACGFMFDEKIYVVSAETKERIKGLAYEYLASGAKAIFYEEFYARNEGWLFEASIISEGMLNSILRSLFPQLTFTRAYFGVVDLPIQAVLGSEIMRIWGDDVLLSYEQLSERLMYVPLERIKSALAQNGDFLWNSVGLFTHISKVEITGEERETICETVQRGCDAQGYISMTDLPLNEIAAYHHDLSVAAIHSAAFHMCLSDKFDRSGKIITRKGDKLNLLTIMEDYCRTIDKCSLEDLLEYEQELTGVRDRWIAMEAGGNTLVRNDFDSYLADRYLLFDCDLIDQAISHFVVNDYLPLKSFATFAIFPNCGQPWNLFLLESYVYRFSKQFQLKAASFNGQNIGVVARRDSPLVKFADNELNSNYEQILSDALARASVALEKEEALQFLFDEGYIGKRRKSNINELLLQAKNIRDRRD